MEEKKIALVFPGQGSQTIGMLHALSQEFAQVSETFNQASEVLGYDLWDLVQQGPEEQLNRTEYTQPALLVAGVAVWKIWSEIHNIVPAFMAGHSLGEYTALVCAEAITFTNGVQLVRDRGRYMQEAYDGPSAMVAIVGLNDELVNQLCVEAAEDEVLVPANYNSIGQTVLAGQLAAGQRVIELAKKAGAKIAKILPMSVPSHCILMKPAADLLAKRLEQIAINSPKVSFVNNVDVACYDDSTKISNALIRQLYNPVRWVETIQFMVDNGVSSIFECGPGRILTGMNKRIDSTIFVDFLGDPEKIKSRF